MPTMRAGQITMHYDQQGAGEPLVLIPYLAADHACYAFQVAEYAKHFTCISVDLRGTGGSDKPEGAYTTEVLADDVAAFMRAAGIGKRISRACRSVAAIGLWLAAKYPEQGGVVIASQHLGEERRLPAARWSRAGRSWRRPSVSRR